MEMLRDIFGSDTDTPDGFRAINPQQQEVARDRGGNVIPFTPAAFDAIIGR